MNLTDDFFDLKDKSLEYGRLENSYLYARLNTSRLHINEPIKLNGALLFKVNKGTLKLEINLNSHEYLTNSISRLNFGSLVKPLETDEDNEIDIIFFHKDFLQNININFAAISTPMFIERQYSDIILSPDESELIDRYLSILKENTRSNINIQMGNNIASSMLAALIYQLVGLLYKRISDHNTTKGQRSSRFAYVHDFIKLVHVHYIKERSVAFYADKLFISPKYLSLLVKETTGKSAARWIDEFVLMEAKNLLRFSGKNVQQVAYTLNFSNQSSFGKYFKHLTGLSPTEYQKS